MKKTIALLLPLFVLMACNQESKSGKNETAHTVSEDTDETVALDCSTFSFESVAQQADTLVKYANKSQADDETFFCAFPNSFKEMQDLFGYDLDQGAAPLYETGGEIIDYFAALTTIPKDTYYDKYINICVNGVWEADNIRDAFGFANLLKNDTEAACFALSKRPENDVKSVFRFIFDGPHPNNEVNEVLFNELMPLVSNQDEKLAELLKTSYETILAEDDGHGR